MQIWIKEKILLQKCYYIFLYVFLMIRLYIA